ncbi:MAG TPA: HAMP domain-containing sensor histidine kinase [Kofleriaceae bacterium]|nr:HAMP domain-containing sensor histidine kinase [Kofleriaceae bacterium]
MSSSRDESGQLAQLVAGVAHDLRNLVLFPLATQIELVERALRLHDLARARALVAELAELLRGGELAVDRLRRFGMQAGDSELRVQAVSPDQLAARAVELARSRPRSERPTALAVELAAPEPIRVDPGEVIAALLNLIVNAIDVLSTTGGTVIVRTGRDDHTAWFEIADDGPGIPPEVRERLFDPFFTTKGDDATGIGLAMVEACMRRHGGAIDLDSAPGLGTKFRLRFPL